MKNSVLSLPKRKAEFIEPMECAPVTKLFDGPGCVYEIAGTASMRLSSLQQAAAKILLDPVP